jgi:hypothetical protein
MIRYLPPIFPDRYVKIYFRTYTSIAALSWGKRGLGEQRRQPSVDRKLSSFDPPSHLPSQAFKKFQFSKHSVRLCIGDS